MTHYKNSPTLTTFYAAAGHLMMHMFAAFYFVIVLAIEDDWKFSYDELINLWLIGSLLVGLGAIPAGWLSDRWSRSGMVAIMFIGLGITSILCGFSENKLSLMINLSFLGLFCSIYHPAGISWVVNTSKKTGKALGFNNIFGGVGIGIGALSAGIIIDTFNWHFAFIIPGIVSILIGLMLIWHINNKKISLANIVSEKFNDTPNQNQMLKIAIIMLVSITCMAFVYQILQSSLPKAIDIRLSEKLSLDTSDIGIMVSLIYIISGVMNFFGGILADKYSEKNIYLIGIIGQGCLLLFIFSLSNYFLIIISLFIVAFNSSILPAENLLLARFSPQKHQSLVYGIKFIVSFAIAPIALFLIATSYEVTREFSYLYLSCGIMMIILFLIVLSLPNSKKIEINSTI
jgi:MFS family permease